MPVAPPSPLRGSLARSNGPERPHQCPYLPRFPSAYPPPRRDHRPTGIVPAIVWRSTATQRNSKGPPTRAARLRPPRSARPSPSTATAAATQPGPLSSVLAAPHAFPGAAPRTPPGEYAGPPAAPRRRPRGREYAAAACCTGIHAVTVDFPRIDRPFERGLDKNPKRADHSRIRQRLTANTSCLGVGDALTCDSRLRGDGAGAAVFRLQPYVLRLFHNPKTEGLTHGQGP